MASELLRQLQVDVRRSFTSAQIVDVLDKFSHNLPQNCENGVETLVYVLVQLIPKLLKSPDWTAVPALIELITSKLVLIDAFLALRRVLPSQDRDPENALTRHKNTQELVLTLFRKFFVAELDWPASLVEQAAERSLDSNQMVEMIFRFR